MLPPILGYVVRPPPWISTFRTMIRRICVPYGIWTVSAFTFLVHYSVRGRVAIICPCFLCFPMEILVTHFLRFGCLQCQSIPPPTDPHKKKRTDTALIEPVTFWSVCWCANHYIPRYIFRKLLHDAKQDDSSGPQRAITLLTFQVRVLILWSCKWMCCTYTIYLSSPAFVLYAQSSTQQ